MKLRLALIAYLFTAAPATADEHVKGEALVRDAVTIAVGGGRFRLEAISPPKDGQVCGTASCADSAKIALVAFINGRSIVCAKSRKLGHGFFLGKCAVEDRDLGEYLLTQGLAVPDADASEAYRAAAEQAKAAKKGLWQGGA
jgi:endonuclease YncB( thermonuclease family)